MLLIFLYCDIMFKYVKLKLSKYDNYKMKKILLVFIPFLLVHCTSPDSKIQHSFEKYFKETANDPESYEFVSIEIDDRATYQNVLDYGIKRYKDNLHPDLFKDAEKEYAHKKNDEVAYIAIITFRANNRLGAKVLEKYWVLVDVEKGYEIIRQSKTRMTFEGLLGLFQPLRGFLDNI